MMIYLAYTTVSGTIYFKKFSTIVVQAIICFSFSRLRKNKTGQVAKICPQGGVFWRYIFIYAFFFKSAYWQEYDTKCFKLSTINTWSSMGLMIICCFHFMYINWYRSGSVEALECHESKHNQMLNNYSNFKNHCGQLDTLKET